MIAGQRLLSLFLGAGVCVGYVLAGANTSVIVWLFVLVMVYVLSARIRVGGNHDMRRLAVFAYLFLSFWGTVNCLDNMRNFGTPFGTGGDDASYFTQAEALAVQSHWGDRTGLFDIVLAVWGGAISTLFRRPFELLDLLPLNWATAAGVVTASYLLSIKINGYGMPLWLLSLALLGNYNFVTSTVHLYREPLLLLFLLCGFLAWHEQRVVRTVIWMVPVAVLRGANVLLAMSYLGASWGCRTMKSRLAMYFIVGAVAVVAAWGADTIGMHLYRYSRQAWAYGTNPYTSFADTVESRGAHIAGEIRSGSIAQSVIQDRSTLARAIRPLPYLFFPIRFWPLDGRRDSASPFGYDRTGNQFLHFYNLFQWFSVLSWVVVIPFLLIGWIHTTFNGTSHATGALLYYILCVVAVSYISFQSRHALGFLIFNPLFAGIGYYQVQSSKGWRSAALVIAPVVLCVIVGFNVMTSLAE